MRPLVVIPVVLLVATGCALVGGSPHRGARQAWRDPAVETAHYRIGKCEVVSDRLLDANARAELYNSSPVPQYGPAQTISTTRKGMTTSGCPAGVTACETTTTITTTVGGPGAKVHMPVITTGKGSSDTFHLVKTGDALKLYRAPYSGKGTLIHNRWTEADGEHFFAWDVQVGEFNGYNEGWELVIPTDPTKPGARYVYTDVKTRATDGTFRPTSTRDIDCVLTPFVEAPAAASAPAAPSAPAVPFAGMSIDKLTYAPAESIAVTFAAAMNAPSGEQYWVTVVPAGSADSEYGAWHYVPAGATVDALRAGPKGTYEVRLHDGYPRRANHVIYRQKVTVE